MTVLYATLFYIAAVIFIAGVGRKIYIYAKTPAPLKIPTTPAPTTTPGVVWRIIKEITVFQSLFKANKWIWIFGWLFHFGLLLVLLRHLRYFIESPWLWIDMVQPFGKYGSIAMVVGLFGLWARRFLVDRIRYISSPSDHLILILLISIGISGMLMTFFIPINIIAVKGFIMGLMSFDLQPIPGNPVLLIHLALVIVLLIVFPISKLLHAPGLFFAPTRVQRDNPREQRHVQGWSAEGTQQ